MAAILECTGLTHIYSEKTPFEFRALNNIDLSIEENSITGLIGHTGSGKSTLIKHFNGLLKPTSGNVIFCGQNIWEAPKEIRKIRFKVGLVFQYPEYQLFEETVYKDIAYGPSNMGLDAEEVARRVNFAAELVGLDEKHMNRSPFELSGGQKRRAAIAGVIAMEPELLILDEPTAGLDPRGSADILEHIYRYKTEKNRSVVIVSHNMEDIARVAERIVVMNRGQIAFDGTPSQVFSHGDELEKIGLGAPYTARVIQKLAGMGLGLDTGIYTVQAAVDALTALKGGAARA